MVVQKGTRSPFLAWMYEYAVRASEYGKAQTYLQGNGTRKHSKSEPEKGGEGAAYCQWAITSFERRDSLFSSHSSKNVDELAGMFYQWKDDPTCRWYAQVKHNGEVWMNVAGLPTLTSPTFGTKLGITGRDAVEQAQHIAARRFAELVLAWPDAPQRARYHRLRHAEDRQAEE